MIKEEDLMPIRRHSEWVEDWYKENRDRLTRRERTCNYCDKKVFVVSRFGRWFLFDIIDDVAKLHLCDEFINATDETHEQAKRKGILSRLRAGHIRMQQGLVNRFGADRLDGLL